MELGRFSSLIENIYDAALDPAEWPRLAQRLARSFDAAQDKHHLDLLLPHLWRAMVLRLRLEGFAQNNQIVVDALEKLAVGMIAVDAQATVLFANPVAERLLRAGLGLNGWRTTRTASRSASTPPERSRNKSLPRPATVVRPISSARFWPTTR